MIRSGILRRRMIFGGYLGTVATAFVVIGLAGFGRIRPEPMQGIIGVLAGAVTLSISVWRRACRTR